MLFNLCCTGQARNATEGRLSYCFMTCYSLKIWFEGSIFEHECGQTILLAKNKEKDASNFQDFVFFYNKLKPYKNMN